MQGSKALDYPLLLAQIISREPDQSEALGLSLMPMWHAGTADGGLVRYVTMLALSFPISTVRNLENIRTYIEMDVRVWHSARRKIESWI